MRPCLALDGTGSQTEADGPLQTDDLSGEDQERESYSVHCCLCIFEKLL